MTDINELLDDQDLFERARDGIDTFAGDGTSEMAALNELVKRLSTLRSEVDRGRAQLSEERTRSLDMETTLRARIRGLEEALANTNQSYDTMVYGHGQEARAYQARIEQLETVAEALGERTRCPLCGVVQRRLVEPLRPDPARGEYAMADEPLPRVGHMPGCALAALREDPVPDWKPKGPFPALREDKP